MEEYSEILYYKFKVLIYINAFVRNLRYISWNLKLIFASLLIWLKFQSDV